MSASKTQYNKKWLSKFKQPIIGLSSSGKTEKATLVMLGNQNDKLTWVSADGISVSFANGILIATRGYSQDLMESLHSDLDNIFTKDNRNQSKIFRYLNGQNEYVDHNFSCSVVTKILLWLLWDLILRQQNLRNPAQLIRCAILTNTTFLQIQI